MAAPDHTEAERILARAGWSVRQVVRVFGAGDPGAEHFAGTPLETILWVRQDGVTMTTLLSGGDAYTFEGWGCSDDSEFVSP